MKVCVVIIFPYRGFNKKERGREALFWRLIDVARRFTTVGDPVVVVNHDTIGRKEADTFFKDEARLEGLDICRVWSVDTCQMWLHGWGYVLANRPGVERIVQLPGDIERVESEAEFFNQIGNFARFDGWAIAIGDFNVGHFGAKSLIDQYGTYPLMSVWFPELTRAVLGLPLNRPRSEFLNLKAKTLRTLLAGRKFAYEQTLNMLIGCWDHERERWHASMEVTAQPLGAMHDDDSARQYIGCLDQIERTERLLKQRWRELNRPPDGASDREYSGFIERFHRLDRLSTASRESAAITIRSLLGAGSVAP